MPRSLPPQIDAELVAFLHDLPDGATDAIGKLMSAAAVAGSKKSNKQAWIRLAIQSVIVGFVAIGGLLKLGNVATKDDVKQLESTAQRELAARSSAQEMVNLRLSALEKGCDAANACCNHQADRLDSLTRPHSVVGY